MARHGMRSFLGGKFDPCEAKLSELVKKLLPWLSWEEPEQESRPKSRASIFLLAFADC